MGYPLAYGTNSINLHRPVFLSGRGLVPIWLCVITVVFLACTTLPKPGLKTLTAAYEPHPERRLVVTARDLLKGMGPEVSGIFMLLRNDEALRWRMLLADLAEETLDMQYFIWKGDAASDLLLDRVIKAADRGVRVRMLVDDIHLIGAD
ncbi:MAG: hypothetical protein KJO34_03270, partial [Deltaproteobacteria bacterium]|nr:hypothetical protein [Deltaproteobacteria bacterium]